MHLFTSQVFSAIVLYSFNSSVSLKTQEKQEFRTNCGNMYQLKLLFLKATKMQFQHTLYVFVPNISLDILHTFLHTLPIGIFLLRRMFNNQTLLHLLIIFFILTTFKIVLAVVLQGEVRSWSTYI